jgi:hypothetical protein
MTFKCVKVGGKSFLVADMSKACFEGNWMFAAAIAAVAIAVYVVGIPLLLLVLLFVGQQRGTLAFPEIEFAQHAEIEPEEVVTAARRVNEFFRNRVAYGSLYNQVCILIVLRTASVSTSLLLTPLPRSLSFPFSMSRSTGGLNSAARCARCSSLVPSCSSARERQRK